MEFTDSEERVLLANTLKRWLGDHYSLAERARAMSEAPGYSGKAWSELAELGIMAALLGEEVGGLGGSGHDIAIVFEALGRVVAIEPWLASGVLSAHILAGRDGYEDLLQRMMRGEVVVSFAHSEAEARYDVSVVTSRAERQGAGWCITGGKAVVLHGDHAERLIVSARNGGNESDEDGISLFLLDATLPGIVRRGYATIDGFRAADIVFTQVLVPEDALIGVAGRAYPDIERAIGAAILAVCAEALGAMEVARDITLDYLRSREQFDQPIGRFQVLQHRMVELVTQIEQTRSLVINAASAFDKARHEREAALSAVKYYVGQAGRRVAEEAMQMHGGIALADETPITHYAKRLVMIDHLFGDTDYHLERYSIFAR